MVMRFLSYAVCSSGMVSSGIQFVVVETIREFRAGLLNITSVTSFVRFGFILLHSLDDILIAHNLLSEIGRTVLQIVLQ